MAESTVNFANIVATPTLSAWSQTYIAGKLSAVLSLEKKEEAGDENFLASLGKEVISTLEQEFFTLENKDLDSIKTAISASVEKIQDISSFSYVITFIAGNVMYIFICGSGSVILKRGSKIGSVLESNENTREIKSASGFLKEGDLVILASSEFSQIIPMNSLASSLDHQDPANIVETLAPKIHEKNSGGASAIIFTFKEKGVMPILADGGKDDIEDELVKVEDKAKENESEAVQAENEDESLVKIIEEKEEEDDSSMFPKLDDLKDLDDSLPPVPETPKITATQANLENPQQEAVSESPTNSGKRFAFSIPSIRMGRGGLGHRRRLMLTITLVILVVLVVSVFLAIKNRNDSKTKALFAGIYTQAQDKYNEGKSLQDLNPQLANEDLTSAQKILNDNKNTFKKGSDEEKKITSLLAQVNSALGGSQTSTTNTKEVSSDSSDLLSVEINNPSVTYFTSDDKNIYFIDGAGIQKVDKSTQKKTQLVKKSWSKEAGIGVFLGNLYIADSDSSQIYKYAANTFVKSNYLASDTDLSNVNDMTIDGAIYLINKDGSIKKYLKGTPASFSLTGVAKKISSSARIRTDADSTNLYVLDKGNSRVVVLDKNGKFIAQYLSPVIKNARDFDVSEKNKKIFILSGGKVYELTIK